MKSYSTGDKPDVKKNRSYDISNKSNSNLTYDLNNDVNNDDFEYENDTTKKHSALSKILVLIGVLIIFVCGIVIGELILTQKSTQDPNTQSLEDAGKETVDEAYVGKLVFTDIDTSQSYTVGTGDELTFPCSSNNKNVYFVYSFTDKTTGNYYSNSDAITGGESATWVPSDYITDSRERVIEITQTVYSIKDTTQSSPIGEKSSQITLTVSDADNEDSMVLNNVDSTENSTQIDDTQTDNTQINDTQNVDTKSTDKSTNVETDSDDASNKPANTDTK